MSEIDQLRAELERARRAFNQNPVPSLSTIIKRLAARIDRMERSEKKNGTGRKAAGALPGAGYQLPKTLTLDLQTVNTLERLGNGNLSAGARKAAAIIETISKNTK